MKATVRWLVMGLGALALAPAAEGAITAADIQDAILGRRAFTDAELAAMDLNGDGALDVADLVVLANPVVEVSFHDALSVVDEGDPAAGVAVEFSGPFVGPLSYEVRALPGGAAKSGRVVLNGTSGVIPIPIADDDQVADAQTYEVALLESTGYELGARRRHTLVVEDNDAIWNGSYQSSGLSVHLQMKIVRQGGLVSGALVSDGFGIIPTNGDSAEWTLESIALTDKSLFSAEVGGIRAEGSQTGVAMERRFRFEAEDGVGGKVVDASGTIAGEVTEWVTAATAPYLNRTLEGGSFRLVKQIPEVVVPEPVLVPAQ